MLLVIAGPAELLGSGHLCFRDAVEWERLSYVRSLLDWKHTPYDRIDIDRKDSISPALLLWLVLPFVWQLYFAPHCNHTSELGRKFHNCHIDFLTRKWQHKDSESEDYLSEPSWPVRLHLDENEALDPRH